MTATTALLATLLLLAQASKPAKDEGHSRNTLDRDLRSEGVDLGGVRVKFPTPVVTDATTAEAEAQALRAVAGSDRSAAELTRDSVSAPIVLKLRDVKAESGTVRQADLWFVIHAELDQIDPERVEAGQTVDAGNMRFTSAPVETPGRASGAPGQNERSVRLTARLLDRIHVEATDRSIASKTDRSWVIASQTVNGAAPNRWHPITRTGDKETAGPDRPYPGGASHVRISRLRTVPGALLVEAHFAFFEPDGWFDGAPILRSKIGVIAQDRVRGLRRALAKARGAGPKRPTPGPSGR